MGSPTKDHGLSGFSTTQRSQRARSLINRSIWIPLGAPSEIDLCWGGYQFVCKRSWQRIRQRRNDKKGRRARLKAQGRNPKSIDGKGSRPDRGWVVSLARATE